MIVGEEGGEVAWGARESEVERSRQGRRRRLRRIKIWSQPSIVYTGWSHKDPMDVG